MATVTANHLLPCTEQQTQIDTGIRPKGGGRSNLQPRRPPTNRSVRSSNGNSEPELCPRRAPRQPAPAPHGAATPIRNRNCAAAIPTGHSQCHHQTPHMTPHIPPQMPPLAPILHPICHPKCLHVPLHMRPHMPSQMLPYATPYDTPYATPDASICHPI